MQKALLVVLAVATVGLGVVCINQAKRLRAGEERLAESEMQRQSEIEARQNESLRVQELERTNERLEKQVQQFAKVTTQLRSSEAQQSSNLTALAQRLQSGAARNGARNGAPGENPLGKGMGEMIGQMMKDPAMRDMMREQQKAVVNMMYAGLFKELNLTPDEKEKLRTLLTESQMRNVEAAQGLFGNKEGTANEDATKQLEGVKQQTDAEIKALLGDQRFAQFQDYQQNAGERMQLDQFRTQLAADNLNLQEQQYAQLLQAMKEERTALPPAIPTDQTQVPRRDQFTEENVNRQLQWIDDYNRRVLSRAAQVLTPDQLKQYQAFQEQQASMQKLGLTMARSMFGGQTSGDTAPTPPAKP